MLDLIERRVAREGFTNVTLILGEPADPRLPAASIDLALMVDVYHELAAPQAVLGHIRQALKPNGRLVLIEYKGEDPSDPDHPVAQDDRGAGEAGGGKRRVRAGDDRFEPAAPARADLQKR